MAARELPQYGARSSRSYVKSRSWKEATHRAHQANSHNSRRAPKCRSSRHNANVDDLASCPHANTRMNSRQPTSHRMKLLRCTRSCWMKKKNTARENSARGSIAAATCVTTKRNFFFHSRSKKEAHASEMPERNYEERKKSHSVASHGGLERRPLFLEMLKRQKYARPNLMPRAHICLEFFNSPLFSFENTHCELCVIVMNTVNLKKINFCNIDSVNIRFHKNRTFYPQSGRNLFKNDSE